MRTPPRSQKSGGWRSFTASALVTDVSSGGAGTGGVTVGATSLCPGPFGGPSGLGGEAVAGGGGSPCVCARTGAAIETTAMVSANVPRPKVIHRFR